MKSQIQNNNIKISPSILAADFSNLGEAVIDLTESGADYIHIDVMDGNFVPNITIGPKVVKDIRKHSNVLFDVHLMINNPEYYIDQFVNAGADIITFHVEATTHIDRVIKLVKSYKKKVGVSLVPSTPINNLDYIMDQLDLILVMSVNPGFGGQSFINSQLDKISQIRQKISNTNKVIELSVDGGINESTAKMVTQAGADVLVAGSYIFKNDGRSLTDKINSLRV